MTLAIVSALPDELAALQARLDVDHTQTLAGRTLHRGRLAGHDAILVLCGVGKVAAATTTALLLDRFHVGELLFTGVAGGIGKQRRRFQRAALHREQGPRGGREEGLGE